jgi:DNA (cytosine-5)-methyltransferase 1
MSKLKLVDLCAGTGAFSFVFHNTNMVETIYANDFDKHSKLFFDENFVKKLDCSDINDIDITTIPSMDIITSGFPCQPFSIAGQQDGFNDKRSNVFWKLIEIIDYHKPRFVIFENVKNLVSHDKGNTFTTILNEIARIKYYNKYKILNTCVYSTIPQNRERIYIICFRDKEDYNKFSFDFTEISKLQNIINLTEKHIPDKYYYKPTLKVWNEINTNVTKHISTGTVYQYRRYYIRENKNKLCPTLTANMGTGRHNVPIIRDDKGIRKLTPRECFNLQGFPITFKFPKMSDSSLYKLAGNAVSIPIITLIANKIITII